MEKKKELGNKRLFKILNIFSIIFKYLSMFVVAILVLTFILIPVIFKGFKITDNSITIMDKEIKYVETDKKITFTYDNETTKITNENEVKATSLALDYMRENNIVAFIESYVFLAIILLVFFILALRKLSKFFINILDDKVFTDENVEYLRGAAKYLIFMVVAPLIVSIVLSLFGISISASFSLLELFFVLILYGMSYILEYGCKNK